MELHEFLEMMGRRETVPAGSAPTQSWVEFRQNS